MTSRISLAWAYVKIGVFAVLALYLLLLFIWNRSAVIEPGLSLPFVANYPKPNAVLTLIATGCVAVLTAGLIVSFYKALRTVKNLKEKSRLVKAERDLAELQSKTVSPTAPAEPIPLEGEGPRSDR
jgi:hypothetical protein